MTSFADVTIGKEWNDSLTGTSANNRALPTVSLHGETSYEKLLNLFYPVGCYFSSSDPNFDPNEEWGGTWEKLDEGRTLIQAGDSYPIGSTGGSSTHQHIYGIQLGNYYSDTIFEYDNYAGVLQNGNGTVVPFGSTVGSYSVKANGNNTTSTKDVSAAHYRSTANTSAASTLPPYIAANIWHRTA